MKKHLRWDVGFWLFLPLVACFLFFTDSIAWLRVFAFCWLLLTVVFKLAIDSYRRRQAAEAAAPPPVVEMHPDDEEFVICDTSDFLSQGDKRAAGKAIADFIRAMENARPAASVYMISVAVNLVAKRFAPDDLKRQTVNFVVNEARRLAMLPRRNRADG